MNKKIKLQSDTLIERLDYLCWTQYRLCQEYGEVNKYYSSVSKVLLNPLNSKYITLEKIIKALHGEIYIEWNKVDSSILGKPKEDKYLKRIKELEEENEKLKKDLASFNSVD